MPRFGRYETLDKVGEGSMGVVYRARDTLLGRTVALKMLSADVSAADELHQRLQREAEAIGRLSHPCIVAVYDLGHAEGQLYMAMELLEGDDLRSLIARQITIPIADRVRLLMDICRGFEYAHSCGVVHRDIKPANILVCRDGRVKILDFGLARVGARATITRRGMVLGTPDYMAPEQASGKGVEPRSDIFSAGAVFYEFLTFEKPFRGKTLQSVLYKILSEDPTPLLTISPELPARLAAVIHAMLRKDPVLRPASMADVEAELRRIHAALRRSQGRSALSQTASAASHESRSRFRERLSGAQECLGRGEFQATADELNAVLAADPDCEEAAQILWQALRAQWQGTDAASTDETRERRVDALLAQAAEGADRDRAKVL